MLGEGAYFEIFGFVDGKYSNQTLLKIMDFMGITSGDAKLCNINEEKLSHQLLAEYDEDWIEVSFSKLSSNLFGNKFAKEVRFLKNITGLPIGFALLMSVHEDDSFTISLLFNYTNLLEFEEDRDNYEKKYNEILDFARMFYATGAFLYGFSGVEIMPVSIWDLKTRNESFPNSSEAFFNAKVIDHNLEQELQQVASTDMCQLDGAGYFVRCNKLEVKEFSKWLGKVESYIKLHTTNPT